MMSFSDTGTFQMHFPLHGCFSQLEASTGQCMGADGAPMALEQNVLPGMRRSAMQGTSILGGAHRCQSHGNQNLPQPFHLG